MKKLIAILLAALMLISLAACAAKPADDTLKPANTSQTEPSKNDTSTDNSNSNNPTPEEIEAAIAKALGNDYAATIDVPEDELFLSAIGNLDLTKVTNYVAKQTTVPSVHVDAVVIAECSEGYAEEAVAAINEFYSQSVDYIRQYPFGVAKVEGARLYKVSNTVMFIMAGSDVDENTSPEEEAKIAAADYEKIDNAIKELFGTLPENLAVYTESGDNHGGGIIVGG